jgi:putative membrane protein
MADTDAVLRTVLVLLVVVVSIPFVMLLVAVPFAGGMHTWGGGMDPGSGMGWGLGWTWMALGPFVLLLAIGYGSYRLLGRDRDAALQELRLAYARGELTDDEYETRRQRLETDRDGGN